MAAAGGAMDLSSHHSKAAVYGWFNCAFERIIKAWPASSILGAMSTHDLILFGCELAAPFLFGSRHLMSFLHPSHPYLASADLVRSDNDGKHNASTITG